MDIADAPDRGSELRGTRYRGVSHLLSPVGGCGLQENVDSARSLVG